MSEKIKFIEIFNCERLCSGVVRDYPNCEDKNKIEDYKIAFINISDNSYAIWNQVSEFHIFTENRTVSGNLFFKLQDKNLLKRLVASNYRCDFILIKKIEGVVEKKYYLNWDDKLVFEIKPTYGNGCVLNMNFSVNKCEDLDCNSIFFEIDKSSLFLIEKVFNRNNYEKFDDVKTEVLLEEYLTKMSKEIKEINDLNS